MCTSFENLLRAGNPVCVPPARALRAGGRTGRRYIFSITNVGLVIVCFTPSAFATAFTNAVFPEPRSPERPIKVAPFFLGESWATYPLASASFSLMLLDIVMLFLILHCKEAATNHTAKNRVFALFFAVFYSRRRASEMGMFLHFHFRAEELIYAKHIIPSLGH